MADKVQVELVTPTRVVLDESADMVVVPGGDGDFGVLPGHAPLLSTVRPGTIEVYQGSAVTERMFVAGGFAEVSAERCTILASEALPVADLTLEMANARATEAREAEANATTDSDRKRAQADAAAAEAMVVAIESTQRRD